MKLSKGEVTNVYWSKGSAQNKRSKVCLDKEYPCKMWVITNNILCFGIEVFG